MSKLKLNPEATFKHTVYIPVAGGEPQPVELVYKWRSKKAVDEFVEKHKDGYGVESVMDCVSGWDLEEEFSRGNVEKLLENYLFAALRITTGYIDEIFNARVGN
ncbi:phage tail assembly chaperone [Neisseria musculi]|uniref:Phage protein n=1 Tax=Neisseria musculi TaxID=1815583 RepID=A0A7H1M809_9NEIS|nr:phage tail assembly chaperone [Neisseria musculi]QNT57774.1 hypothetical protein H7A79_1621 [Neisseria musculi]